MRKKAWIIALLIIGLLFFLSSIPSLRVVPLIKQANQLLVRYDLTVTRFAQWIASRLPMEPNELRPLERISNDFYRYARENPVIIEFFLRKIAHVIIFFMITLALFLVAHQYIRRSSLAVFTSFMGGGLLAFLDEYRQTFVDGRFGSWIDVMIDMTGVTLGVCLIIFSLLITKRRPQLLLGKSQEPLPPPSPENHQEAQP